MEKYQMGKRTFKDIKTSIPNLEKSEGAEKVEVLADELDRILSIKGLFQSDGGRELITVLRNNCANAVKKAVYAAKNGENTVPFLLDYSANMDLLSTIQDISIEEELRVQLDEAVKEAMNIRN